MAVTLIDEYEVIYSANTFSPRIGLKNHGKYVGQLVFHPNGATPPPDTADILHYHLEDFKNVLDLLQTEKPMYLFVSGSGGGFENGIKTTAEPVGEGEA